MEVTIPLMAPASSSDSPKIGISITSAGFDYKTPFPISIVTQKINGGPSAGLMFTLTVYNMLSPDDLTRGLENCRHRHDQFGWNGGTDWRRSTKSRGGGTSGRGLFPVSCG